MPRLIRSLFAVLAVLAWVVAGPALGLALVRAAEAAPPVVSDARVGIHPDMTRFVLDVSEVVPFQIRIDAELSRAVPYRVVVELPEVAWQAPPPRTAGVVSHVGHSLTDTGATRVVLDATGPVRVREAFMIPEREGYPPRLVVDLEPVTRDRFLAERGRMAGTRTAVTPAAPPPPVNGPTQVAALPPAASPPPPFKTASPPPPFKTAPPPLSAKVAPARAAVTPPAGIPSRSLPVIALDPGHGGADPGAIGGDGTFEKTITLEVARELKRQLEASGRYKVVLTRDRDVFVRLRDRVARARDAGADIFISLHADSLASGDLRGLSIYTLSEKASDREAEMLAAKENRADAIGGINLAVENDEVASILIDLVQRDAMNQSKRFANMALGQLGREVRLIPSKPLRSAGFAVLTAADVPSVLVELGYLSSGADLELLQQDTHRQKVARALARSLDDYFNWLVAGRRS